MFISKNVTKNLTKAELARVNAVCSVGEDAVDKNVNDYLVGRVRLIVKGSFKFYIESAEEFKRGLGTAKFCYGYCDYTKRKIVLHLDHVLYSSVDEIVDTILHECAHAVAYHVYGDSGHGKDWKKVSRMFGNTAKSKSKHGSEALNDKVYASKKYRIMYLNPETYEAKVVSGCDRKLKNLKSRGLVSDKNGSTVGKLWMVKSEDYERIGPNFDKLSEVAFR